MKINCVLIGLTLCVAGCGGGGGSSHGDDVTVPAPAPAMFQFSDGSIVLGEDKIHVSVKGVLLTLAAPDWQNNLAQHTARDHFYIARRDQSFVAIAVQFDDKPFVKVLGDLEPIGQARFLRYDGEIDIRHDNFQGSANIGLQVNLASTEPRLTIYKSDLSIDVYASINSDGSFIKGRVTFDESDEAPLVGGFFNTDDARQNETLAGAFMGDTMYGTLVGQVAE